MRVPNAKESQYVPCGKCFACLSNRRAEWTFRLKQELKSSASAAFVTLTYDDEYLPFASNGYPMVSKTDVQLFMKRLRKAFEPFKIRYFLVSEYGSNTLRPHYHFILFNHPLDLDLHSSVIKAWNKGHVHIGQCTGASISYCAKYCLSFAELSKEYVRPFMLCSRRPGIGQSYLTPQMENWHREDLKEYVIDDGRKNRLPRYYSKKLFDDSDKVEMSERKNDIMIKTLVDYDKKHGNRDLQNVKNGLPNVRQQTSEAYERLMSKMLKTKSKL